MNLSGGFAFWNFVVPNRLHAGGHQVWQLLKEQTDALASTGFMPNGVDLSEKREITPHPARLDRWKRWWAIYAATRRSMTPSALRGW